MSHLPLDELELDVVEDWFLECYEEDGENIEPEYLYMKKETARSLYGTLDLTNQFHVKDYSNGMVKLVKRELYFAD